MYRLFFLWLTLLSMTSFYPSPEKESSSFHVMSYNIRYANDGDGESAWKYRKERVANQIQFYDVDLLGMQEALNEQVTYLAKNLPQFDWYGVGRDDGKKAGEYSPIFYNKDKFKLLDKGTFWLSETPEAPSKSWDAALPRIATWVKLEEKASDKTFYYFNTHFDHRGEVAREESARLIIKKIGEMVKDVPVILTGDFNVTPDTNPYQVITAKDSPLKDAMKVSKLPHNGSNQSFSGFEVKPKMAGGRIDYVFVNDQVEVLKHGIISDARDGLYPSDHLPVLAEVSLK